MGNEATVLIVTQKAPAVAAELVEIVEAVAKNRVLSNNMHGILSYINHTSYINISITSLHQLVVNEIQMEMKNIIVPFLSESFSSCI